MLRVGGVWAWPLSRCFEWISVKSQQTFELSKRNCQADFDDHNDEDEDDKYQDGCRVHVLGGMSKITAYNKPGLDLTMIFIKSDTGQLYYKQSLHLSRKLTCQQSD